MSFKPWSIASLLRLRCPACGGDTFRTGFFRTAPACVSCGQVFERESGFYAGSIYPMYGATAVLGGLTLLTCDFLGVSFNGCLIAAGVVVVLLSPWIFLYSRLAFIHTDHRVFGKNS